MTEQEETGQLEVIAAPKPDESQQPTPPQRASRPLQQPPRWLRFVTMGLALWVIYDFTRNAPSDVTVEVVFEGTAAEVELRYVRGGALERVTRRRNVHSPLRDTVRLSAGHYDLEIVTVTATGRRNEVRQFDAPADGELVFRL